MAYEPPAREEGDRDRLPEDRGEPAGMYEAASGMSNVRRANPGDYGALPQSYLNVLTKSRVETYEEEMPGASWGKTLLGVGLVTLVTYITKLLLAPATISNFNNQKLALAKEGIYADQEPQKTFFEWAEASANPLLALMVPFTFFAGAALFYVLARAVRGREAGEGKDFMTHSYLLSLNYTPLRVASALLSALSSLSVLGCLGLIVMVGLGIYQLYNAGLSMQASQRLESGKAQMVAFMPWVIGMILFTLIAVLVLVSFGPSIFRISGG